MKTLEFKTEKGEFFLVDLDSDQRLYELQDMFGYGLDKISTWFKLSEATEEQASAVVEEFSSDYKGLFQDYMRPPCAYPTALSSLHSLLKSKGIHLYDNPYSGYDRLSDYYFTEDKTFYNPYLFKKI